MRRHSAHLERRTLLVALHILRMRGRPSRLGLAAELSCELVAFVRISSGGGRLCAVCSLFAGELLKRKCRQLALLSGSANRFFRSHLSAKNSLNEIHCQNGLRHCLGLECFLRFGATIRPNLSLFVRPGSSSGVTLEGCPSEFIDKLIRHSVETIWPEKVLVDFMLRFAPGRPGKWPRILVSAERDFDLETPIDSDSVVQYKWANRHNGRVFFVLNVYFEPSDKHCRMQKTQLFRFGEQHDGAPTLPSFFGILRRLSQHSEE